MAACPGLSNRGRSLGSDPGLPADGYYHGQGGLVPNVDGERRVHHHPQREGGPGPGPGEELREGIHAPQSRRWKMSKATLEAFIVYRGGWQAGVMTTKHYLQSCSCHRRHRPHRRPPRPTPLRPARAGEDRYTKLPGRRSTGMTPLPGLRPSDGVRSAYLCYSPDLAFPGVPELMADFAGAAADAGVQRLVLLSGRGEDGCPGRRGRRAGERAGVDGAAVLVVRAKLQRALLARPGPPGPPAAARRWRHRRTLPGSG